MMLLGWPKPVWKNSGKLHLYRRTYYTTEAIFHNQLMGVSSFDVIAGEGVGLHNGWCLETMDFVDFLLCCIQSTQNCVAKALVPVLNGPELQKC